MCVYVHMCVRVCVLAHIYVRVPVRVCAWCVHVFFNTIIWYVTEIL